MKNLEKIMNKIEKSIDDKDHIREEALRYSRDIIISCRKAIQYIHQNLMKNAERNIQQASNKLKQLYALTEKFPEIFYAGYVENAAQEVVEAQCLFNIMEEKDLPDPDSLQTTHSAYLLGLCDVVGELRRKALDTILQNESSKSYRYLKLMEEIYDAIMTFDYPSSLVPIKRKQDIVRSIIEKTRGELAVASCERRIEHRTSEFRGLIDKIDTKGKKNKDRKTDNDLNFDRIL